MTPVYYENVESFIKTIFYAISYVFTTFIAIPIAYVFNALIGIFKHVRDTLISDASDTSYIKYGIITIVLASSAIILNMAGNDASTSMSDIYKYLYPMVTLIVGFSTYLFISTSIGLNWKTLTMAFAMVLIIFGVAVYYYTGQNATITTIAYLMSGIITFGILVGLAIILYFYSNYLKTREGWTGFLIHLLFYIPSLILDFIEYIKSEIGATSNVVYYLFIIELLVALLYIYIPSLISKINIMEGTPLLADTAFLDIKKELGSGYQYAFKNIGQSDTAKTTFKRSYSISMWLNLNMQPPNYASYAKETEIFNYGNGLPKITYVNNIDTDGNNSPDVLKVYFTNKGEDESRSYKVNIKLQKWNQIVFNYTSSQVDLFINGHLEKTFIFDGNEPEYSASDLISLGSENGVEGAICNIKYHSKPQSKRQISSSYNLLMNKNPPVNIL